MSSIATLLQVAVVAGRDEAPSRPRGDGPRTTRTPRPTCRSDVDRRDRLGELSHGRFERLVVESGDHERASRSPPARGPAARAGGRACSCTTSVRLRSTITYEAGVATPRLRVDEVAHRELGVGELDRRRGARIASTWSPIVGESLGVASSLRRRLDPPSASVRNGRLAVAESPAARDEVQRQRRTRAPGTP